MFFINWKLVKEKLGFVDWIIPSQMSSSGTVIFYDNIIQSLNAITCIMYKRLHINSSEYTVFLWIFNEHSFEITFYKLTLTAISLHCSKKVFQIPQILMNFLELRFLYATSFSTSYVWCKTKRSSTIFGIKGTVIYQIGSRQIFPKICIDPRLIFYR